MNIEISNPFKYEREIEFITQSASLGYGSNGPKSV